MATTTKIRPNSLVIYRGSKEMFHGIIMRVTAVETYHGARRYTLAYRGTRTPILRHVRPQSLTTVKAKDILFRTCKQCRIGTEYLRGTEWTCGLCP